MKNNTKYYMKVEKSKVGPKKFFELFSNVRYLSNLISNQVKS